MKKSKASVFCENETQNYFTIFFMIQSVCQYIDLRCYRAVATHGRTSDIKNGISPARAQRSPSLSYGAHVQQLTSNRNLETGDKRFKRHQNETRDPKEPSARFSR